MQKEGPLRLQKYLAEAGVASRRASEQFILEGRVTVNGEVVRVLGTKVEPGHDKVVFDGQPVKLRRKMYVVLHKPPGYICSRNDPEKRRTVGELLPKEWQNLHSVGRLDNQSEGLLFLTNDGEFSLRLTHPRYGTRKTYVVTVEGKFQGEILDRFRRGIEDAGEILKAERARLISASNSRSVVELQLAEGKNREVRRLFECVGYKVLRLVRTQIGPIKLGELPIGKWRTLTEPEIKSLLSKI